jgi:LAO/AO transport system kinase
MTEVDYNRLACSVRNGEEQAIARALSQVEQHGSSAGKALLAALTTVTPQLNDARERTQIVGVTGPPGGGKSTLVAALAHAYRERGRRLAILAIDPSSVYTGGAILGDRVRMDRLAGDSDVFIRSLASRGASGGLSGATLDSVTVLEAAGFDLIFIETVGAGQAEIDIIGAARTIAVVSVPGLGDDVQALKAGLLEIADVHVVNKSDREGAQSTQAQLRDMLRQAHPQPGQWSVPIVRTVGTTGEGLAELIAHLDAHHEWLRQSTHSWRRARRVAATRIQSAVVSGVSDALRSDQPPLSGIVDEVSSGNMSPQAAAERILRDGLAHRQFQETE